MQCACVCCTCVHARAVFFIKIFQCFSTYFSTVSLFYRSAEIYFNVITQLEIRLFWLPTSVLAKRAQYFFPSANSRATIFSLRKKRTASFKIITSADVQFSTPKLSEEQTQRLSRTQMSDFPLKIALTCQNFPPKIK